MEVIIRAKNIELTSHLKDYAKRKLHAACRFLPALLEQEIKDREEVGKEVDRIVLEVEVEKITTKEEKGKIFRTEAQMIIPGRVIKAEDTSESVKSSVDKVKHELERQIKDYKEKAEVQKRKGGYKAKKMRE